VYTRGVGTPAEIIASAYVDDVVAAAKDLEVLLAFERAMASRFKMSSLGALTLCLGINITYDRAARRISLSQSHYIGDVLKRFDMLDCRTVTTPMEPSSLFISTGRADRIVTSTKAKADRAPPAASPALRDITRVRSLIGALAYVANCTRPDIAYAVSQLARFLAAPTEAHWAGATRILRYLKGTRELSLTYGAGGALGPRSTLVGYSDANYARDPEFAKSVSGCAFFLNGGAVSWFSKQQPVVALSSTESEYIALAAAASLATSLRNLLADIGCPQLAASLIHADNQPSIHIATNPVTSSRSRHINARFHFIRQCVSNGSVVLKYLQTDAMIADCLTKPLSAIKSDAFRNQLLGCALLLVK
jgi:hypothetical protein